MFTSDIWKRGMVKFFFQPSKFWFGLLAGATNQLGFHSKILSDYRLEATLWVNFTTLTYR